MNTDHFFGIGATHEVCQDYALSGVINDTISFAIVADGCSQSHEQCGQADLGARIVVCAAKDALMDIYGKENSIKANDKTEEGLKEFANNSRLIQEKVTTSVITVGKTLKLSKFYADATLLIAVSDGNRTIFFAYGDGGFSATFPDGSILYRNISFLSGAPYYLSYTIDKDRNDRYKTVFGVVKADITDYDVGNETEVIKNSFFSADETFYNFAAMSVDGADTVSVFSDGIGSFEQFKDNVRERLLNQDVLKEYIGFKNLKGEFVQRRIKRMLKNYKDNNISHYDDISIAAIHLRPSTTQ